ncbi:dihydrofolate reductase family protein [Saprospiraceae bacterium]|nr:dihydrofolate reductase family protein [Saprospiraceae bacterium]
MIKKNIVFIAKSLDGFIAGKNGELDWLHATPNPDNNGMGFFALMDEVDAIVMGRTTFETVLGFGGEWPYKKHVFVLSTSIKEIPDVLAKKATILKGTSVEVLKEIHAQGHNRLYIDGGRTVQNFLRDDLVDELRITTIPILLGGGFPLFGELEESMNFEHIKTEVFLDQLVQSHYLRIREK